MLLSGHSDHAGFTFYTENVKWTSADKVPPSPTPVCTSIPGQGHCSSSALPPFVPAAGLTSGPWTRCFPFPGGPSPSLLCGSVRLRYHFSAWMALSPRSLSKVGTWQVLLPTVMLCFLYSTFQSLIL